MDKIRLSEMLAQLRRELLQAQGEGKSSNIKFLIEDIEIELHVVTTQEGQGQFGIKFWVLSADAQGKASEANTQKVKLKLKPVGPDGKPAPISDADDLPG